jgi:thiol:disulfide interchange protein DsbD
MYEHRIRKGVGAALLTLSGFALVTSLGIAEGRLDFREMQLEEARATARADGKPMLVDFTASWCGACKEMEKKTFSEPSVRGEASRFLALRIDATNDEDPAVQSVMKQLHVVGLPTVLLIDSTGKERFRFNDFVDAREFRAALVQVN